MSPNPVGWRFIVAFYAVGIVAAAVGTLLWHAAGVLLVVFAGVLLAILLRVTMYGLRRLVPLGEGPALALVLLVSGATLGLAGWLLAPGVADQAQEMAEALPRALQQLRRWTREHGLPAPESIVLGAPPVLWDAGAFFSGFFGAVAGGLIALFVAIYLAFRPGIYLNGFVVLFPGGMRQRAREVLEEIGRALGYWLVGKLVSMVAIGALTAGGLALLGVPLALLLGIVAGLLDFIPYIGPIVAGVPAVLIAFTDSPQTALYTLLLFAALQGAEGYLLLPLIERRSVSLPPALTLTMQALFGALFGLAGVALATPLTVVLVVVVAVLYVRGRLGVPVKAPGEK